MIKQQSTAVQLDYISVLCFNIGTTRAGGRRTHQKRPSASAQQHNDHFSCLLQALQAKPRRSGYQDHPVEVAHLDLASLASVRAFATAFNARALPLDALVCNAGVMAPPKRIETGDGLEQQFQVCMSLPAFQQMLIWD